MIKKADVDSIYPCMRARPGFPQPVSVGVRSLIRYMQATALALGILVCIAAGGKDLSFDPAISLYTVDAKKFTPDQSFEAMDWAVSRNRPVVLFIHGRGDEPAKSLRETKSLIGLGAAVPIMERDFDVTVLMFNWDSKADSKTDRRKPLSKMPQSAIALGQVLAKLSEYKKTKGIPVPLTLLAHSMGSVVLQNLVESHRYPLDAALFRSVVLSSSDSDSPGHAQWVEAIAQTTPVYVVYNKDDRVLVRARDQRNKLVKPLGLEPGQERAKSATYLSVTGLGTSKGAPLKSHEVFLPTAMKSQTGICQLFSALFRGNKPDLAVLAEPLDQEDSGLGYHIKFNRNAVDACFKPQGHS